MSETLHRRHFLGLGLAAVSSTALAGCSFFNTSPDKAPSGGGNDAAAGAEMKEAPELAKRVAAGELPPLGERLPQNPFVVQPQQGTGRYGGTMRRGQVEATKTASDYMTYAGLAEWSPTTPPKPQPGLAEWQVSPDQSEYTFSLRKGLKWSDGKPFTTADIEFAFNDVLTDTELNPAYPDWLVVADKPPTYTTVDETTFKLAFAGPHALLLKYLSFLGYGGAVILPKHYMSQFHKKFADADKLKAEMDKDGSGTWMDLFANRNDVELNPERPSLGAWVLEKSITAQSTNGNIVRNPYYWKVDPDGRQLPYIDGARYSVLSLDAIGLRAANGELDLVTSDMSPTALPVLAENEQSKGFKVLHWAKDGNTSLLPNQSHKDPVLAELFGKLEFRAGFSHAINRTELNDAMLGGQGTPAHPCGQPGDEYYVEGMGQKYLTHDVAEANRLLDAAGIARRDDKGNRLRPDGKPMTLEIQTFAVGGGLDQPTVVEYVKRHLAEVGVNTVIKVISSELWYESIPQGDYDICCYPFPGFAWDIDPLWYVPTQELTFWAPRFGRWYHDPTNQFAAEPPASIRELQTTYDKLKSAPSDAERLELGRKILSLHDENVWIIGTLPEPFHPVVAAGDLKSIRTDAIASFRQHYEGATDVSQLWFENPEGHR